VNILFLTTALPYPLHSGAAIRTFNLIKSIAKRYRITFVAFGNPLQEKDNIKVLKKICADVKVIPLKSTKVAPLCILTRSIFSNKPYTIAKYSSRNMKNLLKGFLKNGNIDMIHCDHLHMAQYVQDVTSIPKIIDEHNIETDIAKRFIKHNSSLIKRVSVFLLQYRKLLKYEPSVCKHFNRCLTVSELDKAYIEKMAPEAQVRVIPNGVDLDYFKSQDKETPQKALVFTGAMDWIANEDAMLYFCNDILSLVKVKIPDIKLYIVGRNPSAKAQKLSKGRTDVIITGKVKDVRPYIVKSSVYIVPLRIGGGSRLKILEALAMKKAVVSTSVGCEGLNVSHEKNIIVADTPEAFARRTIGLLENKKLREQMGEAGRRLVEAQYGWDAISKRLCRIYDEVINGQKEVHSL